MVVSINDIENFGNPDFEDFSLVNDLWILDNQIFF
jgi:hypothetical protein